MDVRVGLWRKLSAEELMLLNCGVGEDSRVPWTARRSNPGHPKGDQSWVLIGRTDVEAETTILWPPDAKSWLIWKETDAGKDWGQEEKGTTENEMAGWHHRLNGHEFGWTPGVDDGHGSLLCCDSWVQNKSDMTERVNWTELNWMGICIWLREPKLGFCNNLKGWKEEWGRRELKEGEGTCIPMADSCWCTAEANTILGSSFPSIKTNNNKA